MKRLFKHILSLLRLYDKVAVPGIGVYQCGYVAARVDHSSATFRPPRLEVTFTESKESFSLSSEELPELEILSADSCLLDSYIRKEGLAPEEAWKILAGDISEFQTYLAFGGSPMLRDFELLNPPFPELKIYNQWQRREIKDTEEKGREEKYPIVTDVHQWRDPNYYYVPIHKKAAKIVACLLLVVVVGLFAILPFGSSVNSVSTASIVPISVAESPDNTHVKSDEIAENIRMGADEKENKVEDNTDVIGSESKYSTSDRKESDMYFAVVAAFKTEREANKFIDSHEGDKSRFNIIKDKKYYLISASSTSSKSELEANMPLIRAHYPDAWIFSLK